MSSLGLSIANQIVITDLFRCEVFWLPISLYLTYTHLHRPTFFLQTIKTIKNTLKNASAAPQIPHLWTWKQNIFCVDHL